ncbi:MAG: serine hydrolase [Oscillospiraceae bacterium]|nr:serine hydrolase [Oscillospiraceae bacterium]
MYFERAAAHECGVELRGILDFMEKLETMDNRAFMVLRHGKVVAEGYRTPFEQKNKQMIFSGTKSFAATVIGFAVDEGLISLEDKVISFFPEKLTNPPCENMQKMNIWHLLTMTTGFVPTDPILTCDQPDWIEKFLRAYVTHEPGTYYTYCNMATNMLSAIIEKVTGQSFEDYAKPRLLDPLGITDYHWERLMDGTTTAGFGLNMCIEDYAKLGQLLLQKGRWEGRQLVSEKWVEEMTGKQVDTSMDIWPTMDRKSGYGYQFWRCQIPNVYRADGSKAQFCVVMPDQDAVVVTFCSHQNLYDVLVPMWDHLIPAMKDHVERDPELERLYEEKKAAYSFPVVEGAADSKRSATYSGKQYCIADNRFGITGFSLDFGEDKNVIRLQCGEGHKGCANVGKNGAWARSDKFIEPVGHITIRAMFTKEVSATGAWVGDQYVVRMIYLTSPYEDVWTFDFVGNAVKIHFCRTTLAPGIVAKDRTTTEADLIGYYVL